MSIFISFESLDRYFKLYFKSISHTQKKNMFKLYLKLIVFGQKGFRGNFYNKHRCVNQYVRWCFLHLAHPFMWRTRSWDKNKKQTDNKKKTPSAPLRAPSSSGQAWKAPASAAAKSTPSWSPSTFRSLKPTPRNGHASFGSLVTPKVSFTDTGDPSKSGHWW